MTPPGTCVGGNRYQALPPSHVSHSDSPALPCNQQTGLPRIPPCGERIYQWIWSQTWFPLKNLGDLSQTTVLSWREASFTMNVPSSVLTCSRAPSSPTLTTHPHSGASRRDPPPPPPPHLSTPRPG